MLRSASVAVAAALLLAPWSAPGPRMPMVVPNDNRQPAGILTGDTLRLDLEVVRARWAPEADSGPVVEVEAFAERGKPPAIPAPLVRVREGTVVQATITNRLTDSTVTVLGFETRPSVSPDSLVLRPGQTATVIFAAGAPGTYFYHAILGAHRLDKDDEREQIGGAFIVDPAGGSLPDRVFVMNIWGRTIDSQRYGSALTINGRSWPWTERLSARVGDTLRWRVINLSERNHPMHLHGFYFRLEGSGGIVSGSAVRPEDQPELVTFGLRPFRTMQMRWSPDRPGNWLFHCHTGFHVLPGARVNPAGHDHPDHRDHDPARHMSGLILGIHVSGPAVEQASPVTARRIPLYVQEGRPRGGKARRALGFVVQRGESPPAPDSVELPGSTLVLVKGEPTEIVIHNRLRETSSIHWHGIELESYNDGVPGWSGMGDRLAPPVMAGDSFVARMTVPRAGTYIYHTHLNDIEQLTSGLYGPLIVLEPGETRDPARDHIFVAGWDGPGEPPNVVINGDSLPAPLELAAGVTHRLRFINIGPAARVTFTIERDSQPVSWRVIAKDGASYPPRRVRSGPARHVVEVGETLDAELALAPGQYRMVAALPPGPFYQRVIISR